MKIKDALYLKITQQNIKNQSGDGKRLIEHSEVVIKGLNSKARPLKMHCMKLFLSANG